MTVDAAPLRFAAPEEAARANFYALLARLFYAAPDQALLDALAAAPELDDAEGAMALAWRDLASAAAQADPAALKEEFDAAFVGTGKAPVTLYACAYSIRFTNEAPLAQLRGALAALGLGRQENATEPEDHIAALCEVMRYLIAQQKDLSEQRAFFERWIWPSAEPLCDAISR
ncbi:MAG TPA: molecular chaperone TorD family protein, partial [Burkholderiales bacterium]|nr:molecular chaperone TorD family protein [Burkholderiales bacterium]